MRVYAGVRSSWRDDFRTKMLKLYVCNQCPLFCSTIGVCSRLRTSTSLPLLAPLFLLPPLLLESPLFVVLAHPDMHCRRCILLPSSSLHFVLGRLGTLLRRLLPHREGHYVFHLGQRQFTSTIPINKACWQRHPPHTAPFTCRRSISASRLLICLLSNGLDCRSIIPDSEYVGLSLSWRVVC